MNEPRFATGAGGGPRPSTVDELVAGRLRVPGASLYYEVRGTGPALLLIPTGNGDGGPYTPLAEALAGRHTVITYDKRAYSRSPLDAPDEGADRVRADVEDARALIEHVAGGRADVLGGSSGAIVALELLTRHPECVGTAVVHEPPLASVLPDAAGWLAFYADLYRTYQDSGPSVAMGVFRERMGMRGTTKPPDDAQLPPDELAAMLARIRANHTLWFEREVRAYPALVPDVEALRPLAGRLVLGGGDKSRDDFPYQPNRVLSARLGVPITHFPGGHVGFVTHPAAFADALSELLTARRPR
ncbi:alpha/beta hydrolase [Amycolatopsis sp. NPDC051045]|uniref:alpha/beta fold hydrolase n=1 Tax=Amycolatopsis sp. NPDC051045 TaxID=3156922 RepID=UPI003447AEB7